MLICKSIAEAIESCIKQTHIEVTRQYTRGRFIEIHGGAACFSGVDSFLSQVIGWGFHTKEKHIKSEINSIEHFYKSMNHPRVDIELCPYVGNEIIAWLSLKGYQVAELNNISVLDLKAYQSVEADDRFTIREVEESELGAWSKQVALGFGYPEAETQFLNYAKAKGTKAFAAYKENKIVAGATIAVHGKVCDLGVTSTLLEYRGKGLQKRLLHARLNEAKRQGLEIATVTTEPGSISDLNIQKIGFGCAYTRLKMSLTI